MSTPRSFGDQDGNNPKNDLSGAISDRSQFAFDSERWEKDVARYTRAKRRFGVDMVDSPLDHILIVILANSPDSATQTAVEDVISTLANPDLTELIVLIDTIRQIKLLHYADLVESEKLSISIPVNIWLSTDRDAGAVQIAVANLLTHTGFDLADASGPESGSWMRRFVYKTKRLVSSPAIRTQLDNLEHLLEHQMVSKHQAHVDSLQGDAVAKLLTALQGTPTALIQIGSVLLIKVDGVPAVRNLTVREQLHLKQNPALLKDPDGILAALQLVTRVRQPRSSSPGVPQSQRLNPSA